MCGIAGIISKTNLIPIKEIVFAMSQTMKHRGPDGEGFVFLSHEKAIPAFSKDTPYINTQSHAFKFNPSLSMADLDSTYTLAMAHRRLSVIDLSESGHQPMCDVTENYWMTFNGEIYNYLELREELTKKGHVFVTQTDTEVVVAAYKEWGMRCLEKFNGMWAFALLDKTTNQLFCARDRVGVKPFYYVNKPDFFAFASEQKAFIKSKLIEFDINEQQQMDYLVNASLETEEECLFKGIKELKPAHYLVYDLVNHHLSLTPYYAIPTQTLRYTNETKIISLIEEKIVNAIRLRLRSDVEIGSCLSGGLDSSIIAGIANYLQPRKQMKLFTAVFPDEQFDESPYAKLMADAVQGNWKTVTPKGDEFFRDVETLNYYQDLPIWSTSTYSQHRVMQLASENNIKVVLDGQGADELFAGYAHHYMALWKEQLSLTSFYHIQQSKATIPHPYQLFAKQLLKDYFGLSSNYSAYFNGTQKTFSKSKPDRLSDTLNQQLQKDYNGRLKSFLKCEDRCSMAFGIESRVPFADDIELVDMMFSIVGNQKIQRGISKYLLREAAKTYLPQKIYARNDKVGFETPLSTWFLPYKKQVLETISGQLDFVDMHVLSTHYESLLKQKGLFVLRLYSYAVWKNIYTQ